MIMTTDKYPGVYFLWMALVYITKQTNRRCMWTAEAHQSMRVRQFPVISSHFQELLFCQLLYAMTEHFRRNYI
jgi:hypothetical protein